MSAAVRVLDQTASSFCAAAAAHVPTGRALDLYRAVYREARIDAPWIELSCAPVTRREPAGDTVKFLQRHPDGLETESVIIPGRGSGGRMRATLCVSSQVGCAMGCTFCETAQMGLMRHLTTAEIVGQWFAARHDIGQTIDNIVFMGMGEPLDNLDAVLPAIDVLMDPNGAAIGPSRISVSTVGRAEGIRRLGRFIAERSRHRMNLAVSVNAPNDAVRAEIMPVNRGTPMAALMDAMLVWPGHARSRILIEYVLIPGVNDALEHADELCAYLRPLTCTVNVIPYNPIRESPWPAPDDATVDAFIARIAETGQSVRRRQTHGREVMAACGQLGNPQIRRRRFVPVNVGETSG